MGGAEGRVRICLALTMAVWVSLGVKVADSAPDPSPDRQSTVVEGIVLNPMGGGIADALVRVERADAGPDDPPVAETRTNRTGDIHIELPPAAPASLRVRILKEGYLPFVAELGLEESDEPPFIDATLQGGSRLIGRAVGRDDRPVVGAEVVCENGGVRQTVRCDEQGGFAFENLYRGPARLTVKAEGYGIIRRAVSIADPEHQIGLTLEPERAVRVALLTNDGEPAPDAVVEVLVEPGMTYVHTRTGPDGTADLHGIPQEARLLMFRLSGSNYVPSDYAERVVALEPEGEGEVAPGPTDIRLRITVAGRVRGRVVDAQGRPVDAVRVAAGGQQRYTMPLAWTDARGNYELTGIRPGLVPIAFQHDDFAVLVREADVDSGRDARLDVRLARGEPLGGVVVDGSGRPVEHAWVMAESWRGFQTLGMRRVTDGQGRFSFPHAPEGEILFSVFRPGFGARAREKLRAGRTDYRIVLEGADRPQAPQRAGNGPGVGGPAPDLAFKTMDGKAHRLCDWRGRFVFIDIWATWCGPCRAELPNVKALQAKLKDRDDFVLLGVSLDRDRGELERVLREEKITWPQVFGPGSGAEEAFEAFSGEGIPYTVLIGPDGRILATELRGPGLVEEVQRLLAAPLSQPAPGPQ